MSKPFKPGYDERRNLNGRPPKQECLTEILKEHAEKKDVGSGDDKISRKEALAQQLWQLAMKGDMTAIKYIYDRIDGRPVETVNQTIKEIPEYVGFIDSSNTEDTEAD